jgi:branched-chain amino acid transport system ATP-binding protein
VLQVKGVKAGYGDINVLWGVDLKVGEGELVALVGANGVGKSTLLKTISGLVTAVEGDITFEGQSIAGERTHEIVERGVIHIPEGRQLFAGLTVRENLKMGCYLRSDKESIKRDMEEVLELLPRLRDRVKQVAGTLSGGEQQMCAIARGLMAKPKLLIIDELSLGLAPVITDLLIEVIQRIHDDGVTLLIVEQDIQMILEICSRGYVMETGRIVLEGESSDLLQNEHVRKAYLGI